MPLAIGVSAAHCHDGIEGIELSWKLEPFKQLELICADKACRGEFTEAVALYGLRVDYPSERDGIENIFFSSIKKFIAGNWDE